MKKNFEEYNQIYLASFLRKLQASGADFVWWHTSNGGSRNKAEAGKFKLMGVLPGVPDIIIMYRGGVMFLELKDLKGKLSPGQKDFEAAAKRYNHNHHVIYAADPMDMINQTAEILLSLGIADQNGISKSSKSVEDSLT